VTQVHRLVQALMACLQLCSVWTGWSAIYYRRRHRLLPVQSALA
jgi:hypothetical protein